MDKVTKKSSTCVACVYVQVYKCSKVLEYMVTGVQLYTTRLGDDEFLIRHKYHIAIATTVLSVLEY